MIEDITDKKAAEEARFRHVAIVESSEDAIIAKDLNGVITSWNLGAERLFGYAEAQVVGQPITILIPSELRDEEKKILARLRAGGRIEHYETIRVTKTGKMVNVSLTIGPIKDSAGNVVGFTKIAHDITQRKRAEEAVKESEVRFRLVADTAPVMIWMSDTDKLCTYFNKPWLDFTGRSIEKELGNGWAKGVHPDDLPPCLDTYAKSFDKREKFTMEYRLRQNDGEYRWILDIGAPRFNRDGSFAGYIGACVDVTERRRAEETGLKYAAIVESSDDAIVSLDMCGTITSWNIGAERLFGYSASEALGQSILFLSPAHCRDVTTRLLKKLLRGEIVRHHEVVRQRKDGTFVDTSLTAYPLIDAKGSIFGVSGISRDISERKKAEQSIGEMTRKLIEAQEQERARIGRELHDDINQRLALLAIELRQLQDDPSEVSSRARELHRQTIEISNDVQALSHDLHSSKLEYLGVIAGIKSWCREFGERQKMEIVFKSEMPRGLSLDIGRTLFRVVQEALHNAAKHSGVKRVEVQLREESGEVHLVIIDSGRGFNVGESLQGQGLGLTSMHERVRLVNGSIAIDSQPTAGTTIHVRVPFGSEHESQKAAV